MNDMFSRRSLLTGAGSAAIYSGLATQFPALARAGEAPDAAAAPPAQEMVYSTMFMTGPRTKFDQKKYQSRHLPLLKQSLGDSVSRIEMRTGNATARGVPSDVGVTTAVYIADLTAFIRALQANGAAINADLDGISTGPRNIQVDRVLVTIGAERSEVRENHQVVSTFYKEKPGVTFDTKYYTETYLPQLRSYYGESAVRRVEVLLGVPQGGAKPAIVATTHLFIRERGAYDSANAQGQSELMRTDEKYTNADQMWADSKVTAIV